MAIVNVRGAVQNAHTAQSVGGRGMADWVTACLACATADGWISVRAHLECCGPGLRPAERRRKDGDQRRAVLTIDLSTVPDNGRLTVQIKRGKEILQIPLDSPLVLR